MKTNGTWAKYQAIYPLVGGGSVPHGFNLKDTTTYTVFWSGGLTHDANGVTGNGTSGYGNTQYVVPGAQQNDMHVSVYVRNNAISGCAIGTCTANSGNFVQIYPRFGSNLADYFINQSTGTDVTSVTDSRGWLVATRSGASAKKGFRNGSSVQSVTTASVTPTTAPITLLARNATTTRGGYSTYNIAFATIGLNLSDAEIAADYAAIQAFQTALSRQV